MYLLCGDTAPSSAVILQQLICALHSPTTRTAFLAPWARQTPDWAPKLIEALAIVRADSALRRYGLHLDALVTRYLPRRPDAQDRVHPIAKWLAHICELLRPPETARFIEAVLGARPERRDWRLTVLPDTAAPERYLELWLLHWQTLRAITLGEWRPYEERRGLREHCAVDAVIDGLSALATKQDDRWRQVADNLRQAQIRFNCTSEGFIQRQQKPTTPAERKESAANEEDGNNPALAQPAAVDEVTGGLSAIRLGAAKSDDDDDNDPYRYRVRASHAGFALIIDQTNFHTTAESAATKAALGERDGSASDRSALMALFSKHGYRCEVRVDCTAAQMEEAIADVVRRSDKRCDSLVLCVLSHGILDHVYGSDTVPVPIRRIEELMACRQLAGKPKLLIVQACQGDQEHQLVLPGEEEEEEEVGVLASDGPLERHALVARRWPCAADRVEHVFADMCVMLATMPRFPAFRHTQSGSWFVQALCAELEQHGRQRHLLDCLTRVTASVSRKFGEQLETMVPQHRSTLKKHFFLPQL